MTPNQFDCGRKGEFRSKVMVAVINEFTCPPGFEIDTFGDVEPDAFFLRHRATNDTLLIAYGDSDCVTVIYCSRNAHARRHNTVCYQYSDPDMVERLYDLLNETTAAYKIN